MTTITTSESDWFCRRGKWFCRVAGFCVPEGSPVTFVGPSSVEFICCCTNVLFVRNSKDNSKEISGTGVDDVLADYLKNGYINVRPADFMYIAQRDDSPRSDFSLYANAEFNEDGSVKVKTSAVYGTLKHRTKTLSEENFRQYYRLFVEHPCSDIKLYLENK